jgi:hypothetical protein
MANISHWARSAFSHANIIQGYALSAIYPLNLGAFIRRWSGRMHLTDLDQERICEAFPYLVDIVDNEGCCDDEVRDKYLGWFIDEIHENGLSAAGLAILERERQRKPEVSRPINQRGSCILTNNGFLEGMYHKGESKLLYIFIVCSL